MITALVQYKLPPEISREDCEKHFHGIAPGFRSVPGLHRKNFICADDGWAGGVYLWENREDAEKFYTGPWRDGIRSRYHMDPVIKYFDTFAITDNVVTEAGVRLL